MTSPSEPIAPMPWKPVPALDPYAGRQHDEPVPLIERREASAYLAAKRDSTERAFSIRLDRAAAAFAIGNEIRARQWINEAAHVAFLPIPWPELGTPKRSNID